jgi:predicted RNA binding protein YcfA (HicA-like mRNA interferase family)
MKGREFLRRLKRHGVLILERRGKGGHCRLMLGDRMSVLSMHGAKDLDPEYLKAVCRQLGLDPREVL